MATFSLAAVINSPEDFHAAVGTATDFASRGVIADSLLSPATMMGGAGLGSYEPDLAPNAEGKCPVCSKQLIVAGCTHNYKACGQHVFVCERDRCAKAVRDRILDALFQTHPTCPGECSKSKAIKLTGNIKTGRATARAIISSCNSGPFNDPAAYFVHLNLTHCIPVGGKNLASKSLILYCCKCKEWVEGYGESA